MVLVSGGLEGAALPFAVVWVCGLEGGRCFISFGCWFGGAACFI